MRKWFFMAAMFYAVNMLNNWAFAFNISVPVHIILRSFGSVFTMLAGWIRGKKYSVLQVLSVAILTAGVLVSAWADAAEKVRFTYQYNVGTSDTDHDSAQGKTKSTQTTTSASDFTLGLTILLVAQALSAYMGVYTEDVYANHGASWSENLFYSHFLALPLFLPLSGTLQRQYARLAATPALDVSSLKNSSPFPFPSAVLKAIQPFLDSSPRGLVFLMANAMTQLLCISGVNILCARASAVTVTIVLNIRKLVSFILSTWLFGHHLGGMMMLGAALVFGSGALYGWETSWRLPGKKAKSHEGASTKKRGLDLADRKKAK